MGKGWLIWNDSCRWRSVLHKKCSHAENPTGVCKVRKNCPVRRLVGKELDEKVEEILREEKVVKWEQEEM